MRIQNVGPSYQNKNQTGFSGNRYITGTLDQFTQIRRLMAHKWPLNIGKVFPLTLDIEKGALNEAIVATEFDVVEIGDIGRPIWKRFSSNADECTAEMKKALAHGDVVDFENPKKAEDMLSEMQKEGYDIEKVAIH